MAGHKAAVEPGGRTSGSAKPTPVSAGSMTADALGLTGPELEQRLLETIERAPELLGLAPSPTRLSAG